MVIQKCIPISGQMGTGGSDVKGHPGIHSTVETLKIKIIKK